MVFIDLYTITVGVIVVFGIIISYEDIKKKRIMNKYLLYAIIYSIVVNTIYVFLEGGLPYLKALLVNSSFSLFVGFLLWYVHLWTAGDGKLFFTYSLLVPLTTYFNPNTTFFPSYILLINTFVPLFIVFLISILIQSKKEEKIKAFKFMTNPYTVAQISLVLFGFVWLLSFPLSVLNIQSNYFVNILLLFFTMQVIAKVSEKYFHMRITHVSLLLAVVRMFFEFSTVITISFAKQFVSILISYLFLRHFILRLGFYGNSKSVRIEDLEVGDVPMEKLVAQAKSGKKQKYGKKEVFFSSIIGMFNKEKSPVFGREAKGMTPEEVSALKKMHKSGKLDFDELLIHKTLPFAPFMFVGVLLTLVSHGSVFVYIVIRFLM